MLEIRVSSHTYIVKLYEGQKTIVLNKLWLNCKFGRCGLNKIRI